MSQVSLVVQRILPSILAVFLCAEMAMFSGVTAANDSKQSIVLTDITITYCDPTEECVPSTTGTSPRWQRVQKDLYLHGNAQQTAWLDIMIRQENELSPNDLVVMDVSLDKKSVDDIAQSGWESRPGGLWLLRSTRDHPMHQPLTSVDVLFGTDAVDPRPQWELLEKPIHLERQGGTIPPRLTIERGHTKQGSGSVHSPLRTNKDGNFKIVQISDTHMVTGVGVCKDAIDADGSTLPESEADPLTVKLMQTILDEEKPDLVVLAGDQLHHDIPDSQSPLFKVVAPIIEREIPFAMVFGNHDAEGAYATSRAEQMALYASLPYSLADSGPSKVDGVGNYILNVYDHSSSSTHTPLITLYFLDSHGETSSEVKDPDYDPIQQSQIAWFRHSSQSLRHERENRSSDATPLSLAFMHIPLPEFGSDQLIELGGHRREPTEGPSINTHFYDALSEEGVAVIACGHDHVNDFCGQLPPHGDAKAKQSASLISSPGPWLCYGGGSGFGGYCSYGTERYYRRARVWEFETRLSNIKTWKRVEYTSERKDEMLLVEKGKIVSAREIAAQSGNLAQVVLRV